MFFSLATLALEQATKEDVKRHKGKLHSMNL